MKILGEKSLSSKVELGLEILFLVIALVTIGGFLFCSAVLFLDFSSSDVRAQYLTRLILLSIISAVVIITGIVALFIIYQFIKIFKNLKENKVFEKENLTYLEKISKLSMIIGTLYFIILVGVSIVLNNFSEFGFLSNTLIKMVILILSGVFLIFGIGIKILNEIYKKAIKYKEENELTV